MKSKSFAIYVCSFDGYCDLWNPFFSILDSFWPDCIYPKYLINNTLDFSWKDISVIHSGKEINWFNRAIRTLEMINEDYVLFMLEDYFLSKRVKNEDIEEILNYMHYNGIYYYQLSLCHLIKKEKKIRTNISDKMKYPISLQPAIWKRHELLRALYKIKGETPWDFELYFASLYENKKEKINGVAYDTRDILGYKNGVLRGKWISNTLKYYRRLAISFNTENRGILSLGEQVRYSFAVMVSDTLSSYSKMILKKILNFFKIKYL